MTEWLIDVFAQFLLWVVSLTLGLFVGILTAFGADMPTAVTMNALYASASPYVRNAATLLNLFSYWITIVAALSGYVSIVVGSVGLRMVLWTYHQFWGSN